MTNSMGPAPSSDNQWQVVCRAFQDVWQNGGAPSISDYLKNVEAADRSHLLRELLQVDIMQRREWRKPRSRAQYEDEFPDHREIIAELFDGFGQAETVDYSLKPDEDTRTPHGDVHAPTVVPEAAAVAPGGATASQLGDYELLHEIARGGMGVVFKARQNSLNRIVALKMIKAGELAGDEEVRRFHTEAEAAAKLDHPHIVPIYEVGEDDGRHYFSMGFVNGQGLDARLKDGPLPEREAAELTAKIAAAVQYAHERGVVHRDLKPSNVLIDAAGEPRVTDFGLAKTTETDSSLTATGQVMGTPSYMPPEQAAGMIGKIGPLSDVYSLGALLYCLLTGRPPFQAANIVDTLRQVVEQEPVSPRQLNPSVSKDLETICLKCLEKEPASRYASAQSLAEDLRRSLNREPIVARPIGRLPRVWRWCRRNPAVAVLTFLVLVVLGSGSAGVTWQWRRAESNLGTANERTEQYRQQKRIADQQTVQAQTQLKRAEEQTRRVTAQRLADLAGREYESTPDRGLLLAAEAVDISLSAGDVPEPIAVEVLEGLLHSSQTQTLQIPQRSESNLLISGRNEVAPYSLERLSLSRDGEWLAVGVNDKTLLWSTTPDNRLDRPHWIEGQGGANTAITIASSWLAVGRSSGDICIYPLTKNKQSVGDEIKLQGHLLPVSRLLASPDGRWLFSQARGTYAGSSNKPSRWRAGMEAFLWRLEPDGRLKKRHAFVEDKPVGRQASFDPASRWLLTDTGYTERPLQIRDLQAADPTAIVSERRIHQSSRKSALQSLQIAPDGGHLLATTSSGTNTGMDLIDVRMTELPSLAKPRLSVISPADNYRFSPDGRWLAGFGDTSIARIWDTSVSPPAESLLSGHEGRLAQLEFSPNNRWLVTASRDGEARLWDLQQSPIIGHVLRDSTSASFPRVAFGGDGNILLVGALSGPRHLWHLVGERPDEFANTILGDGRIDAMAIHPTQPVVALVINDLLEMPRIELWSTEPTATPRMLSTATGHAEKIESIQFTPNHPLLVAYSRDVVQIWNLEPKIETPFQPARQIHADWTTCEAFTPDGRFLAIGRADGDCVFVDLKADDPAHAVTRTHAHRNAVLRLAYSGDGKRLFSTAQDAVLLWKIDPVGHQISMTLRAPTIRKTDDLRISTSPTGQHLLVCGGINKFDLYSETPAGNFGVETLLAFRKPSMSANGESLIVNNYGPNLRHYRLDRMSNQPLSPTERPNSESRVHQLLHTKQTHFSVLDSTGRWLATADIAGGIRIWDLKSPDPTASSRSISIENAKIAELAISPRGERLSCREIGGNTVTLWDLTGEDAPRQMMQAEHSDEIVFLSFDPRGRWLFTSSKNQTSIHCWDTLVPTPAQSHLVIQDSRPNPGVTFSDNGRWMVVHGTDDSARLYALDRKQGRIQLERQIRHRAEIHFANFSMDGRWLTTADGEGQIKVSSLPNGVSDPRELTERAKELTGRVLTPDERREFVPNVKRN